MRTQFETTPQRKRRTRHVAESVQDNQSSAHGRRRSGDPMADFGANEWLVDEMYERFQADPDSVDRRLGRVLQDPRRVGGANGDAGRRRRAASEPTTAATAARPATKPAPRSAPARAAEAKAGPTTPTADDSAAAAAAVTRTHGRAKRAAPTTPAVKRADAAAGQDRRPGAQGEDARRSRRGQRRADADPAARRPARTAQNMDLSLTVPTATSVRSVPVKLLWDNRIVINNHLARARGGKVSFTHLIGYALVKALREMPEMNNALRRGRRQAEPRRSPPTSTSASPST